MLLDEPTLALDLDSRQSLWQHLLEANAAGATLLLATNDVYEAERYCHTVALMDQGRVVAQGAPAELKRGLRRDAVRVEWKTDSGSRRGCYPRRGPASATSGWPAARRTSRSMLPARSWRGSFQEAGDRVHGVQIEESTLEDVYFQLVGKTIAAATADGEGA